MLVVDNKIVYYVSIDGKTIKQMLGSSIRELRIDKGITQEKLAELLELGVNTTNRIETGTSFITSETFAKLCIFLMYIQVFFCQLNQTIF